MIIYNCCHSKEIIPYHPGHTAPKLAVLGGGTFRAYHPLSPSCFARLPLIFVPGGIIDVDKILKRDERPFIDILDFGGLCKAGVGKCVDIQVKTVTNNYIIDFKNFVRTCPV